MVDMKTILTQNSECPVREVGNGLVIANPVGDDTLSIAEIGTFIWHRLDGTMDLDDILMDILQEYEVARNTAEEDLQAFISQLMEAGLVQPV